MSLTKARKSKVVTKSLADLIIKKSDCEIELNQGLKEIVQNHLDLQDDYKSLFDDKHELEQQIRVLNERIEGLERQVEGDDDDLENEATPEEWLGAKKRGIEQAMAMPAGQLQKDLDAITIYDKKDKNEG